MTGPHGGGFFVELSLSSRVQDDHAILAVGGEIDVYTASQLRERLSKLSAEGYSKIVVDMEAVDFLDSSGLGVLIGGLKTARLAGGRFTLVCTQPKILKIFRVTGLEEIFGIHASVDEALAAE